MAALVFLSSVIEGFEAFREAAARGIAEAGCRVLRVEDLPSQDRSPRNACLDLVGDADIYLLVVGANGGWTAPSGQKATEEEFEHARRLGKSTIVFLTDEARDEDAERLARLASDYVGGRFRVTVSNPEHLRREVSRALRDLAPRMDSPVIDPARVQEAVLAIGQPNDEATLRLAVAPERASGDFVDILTLEDSEFLEKLYELGHAAPLRLFDYEASKSAEVRRDSLVVEQGAGTRGADPVRNVRMELSAEGLLVIDLNVTGLRPRNPMGSMADYHLIVEADVTERAELACRAAGAIFDLIDPHYRDDRLMLNFALGGIGYRQWSREGGERRSFGMRMDGADPVAAFEEPRMAARSELKAATELVRRAVAMLRREVGEG